MADGRDDRGRTIYLAVLAAMVTSVATTYGLRALEPAPAAAPREVLLPSLEGLEGAAATAIVESMGLRVDAAREPGPAAAGSVLRQSPAPWTRLSAGDGVSLVLSTGEVVVPDVTGRPRQAALTALQAAGLQSGPVEEDEAAQGDPGTVVRTRPEPGATLQAGAAVTLVVVAEVLAVPDLRGQTRAQATEALEALGLAVGRVRLRYAPSEPELSVLEVEPAAGTRVEPGTKVDLVLAE